jgi:uncharacterized circularly permuted ATP-grasp superfamily protein
LALVAQRIEQHPPNWVAQPMLSLSTMPTLCDGVVCPRHVDLRPFTLFGPDGAYVAPGGLTRVARQAGSLIVNSSQGGGSKDTWIVDRAIVNENRVVVVEAGDGAPDLDAAVVAPAWGRDGGDATGRGHGAPMSPEGANQ